jgi:hypothetical protein
MQICAKKLTKTTSEKWPLIETHKEGISGHLQIVRAKMNKDDWREMSLVHGITKTTGENELWSKLGSIWSICAVAYAQPYAAKTKEAVSERCDACSIRRQSK